MVFFIMPLTTIDDKVKWLISGYLKKNFLHCSEIMWGGELLRVFQDS